jgi:two-component system sensor histidine kinase ChvG
MAWRQVNLTLDRRIAKGVTVLAAPDILETVFENVLENAVSFSPAGGHVHVSLQRVDGGLEAQIKDEGPGVPEQKLERIFERYVSERPAAGADGRPHFGIGLWIVRRNVEAMGGHVHAENRKQGGLCMVIRLPATA